MNRRIFIKNVLYGAAVLAAPVKAARPLVEAFTPSPDPFTGTYTGHTNAVRCMVDLLLTVFPEDQIDFESFERVEENLDGVIPPEVIADGFVIGPGGLSFDQGVNRLCDIGQFFVYYDKDSKADPKITCMKARENLYE